MDGKRKLTANLTVIKEMLSAGVEPVCDKLIEREVIPWETKDELDAIPGSQKKVDHILKRVIAGGHESYLVFIEVLRMCGYSDLADTVEHTNVSTSVKMSSLDHTDSGACSLETVAEVTESDLKKMKPITDLMTLQFEMFKEEQRKNNRAMLEAQQELHNKANQELQDKLSGVMNLITELEKRRNENVKLEREYKRLQESYKCVQEKMKEMQSRLSSLNKEAHNYKNELSITTKEKFRIENELNDAKKELEQKETDYNVLYLELQQARADLQKEPTRDDEFQKYMEAILRVESFIKDERQSSVKPEPPRQKLPIPVFSRNTSGGVGGLRGDPAPRKTGYQSNSRRQY